MGIADTPKSIPSSPPRRRAKMGLLSSLYGSIVKRNTTFLATIFVGAFATEIAFETGANSIWDSINKGRQWKDIKQRYMEAATSRGRSRVSEAEQVQFETDLMMA